MKSQEKTQEHCIYSDLDKYIDFYDSLEYRLISFYPGGTEKFINVDQCIISCIKYILMSIKILLESKNISDAYALTRRYDDLIIINAYIDIRIQKNLSISSIVVEEIDTWVKKYKSFDLNKMKAYIKNEIPEFAKVFIENDNSHKEIRRRLNDYVHFNSLKCLLLNTDYVSSEEKSKILDIFRKDIRNLFIKHFILFFSINEIYMSSTDYIDEIEAGNLPPEEYLYYVAPFIEKTYENIIKKYSPQVAEEFKKNIKMKIE